MINGILTVITIFANLKYTITCRENALHSVTLHNQLNYVFNNIIHRVMMHSNNIIDYVHRKCSVFFCVFHFMI